MPSSGRGKKGVAGAVRSCWASLPRSARPLPRRRSSRWQVHANLSPIFAGRELGLNDHPAHSRARACEEISIAPGAVIHFAPKRGDSMASAARFIQADRVQTRWDFIDLEALLPSDHRARVVMSFVESLDLSELYDAIKAREGEPGRPPPDPAVVMGLWLYATIEGVGSARQLERLAERDLAYRWIAGGVPLNYHGLA